MNNDAFRTMLPCARKTLAAAVSTAIAGSNTAYADQLLEEIIVTASKREQTLQEIPLAITAFTTGDIEKRGFDSFEDYAKFVPGLSYGQREPGGTSIVFRGVASSGLQFGARSSSCVYLDEQPITAAGLNPDPRLIDIERVEALRGPQATLFGDSCQSGALRILTNKPDAEAFDSWIEATGSKVEDGDAGYDVSAMINIPLGDRLAIRLSGFRAEEAGYVDNVLGTSPGGTFDNAAAVDDDVNTSTYTGGRAVLRWDPTDDLTINASAMIQETDVDGFGDVNLDAGDLEQIRFKPETLEDDWYQLGLSMEARLGWADATVTGSYFNRDFRYNADAVDYQFGFQQLHDYFEYYLPGNQYLFYDFGGDVRGAYAIEDVQTESWSIEARLTTPADSSSRWKGLIGIFYNKTKSNTLFQSGNQALPGSDAFTYLNYLAYYVRYGGGPGFRGTAQNYPLNPTTQWFFGQYDQTLEQLAFFGEASFDFTDNFTITVGGRWFDVDEKRRTIIGGLGQGTDFPNLATDLILTDETVNSSEDGFLPKVNLEYRIRDDKMIYFTYSEGFRSGGGNAGRRNSIFGAGKGANTYDSDFINNFEFGTKTTWLDGRLQINAAAYQMKWKDIQLQVNDPDPLIFQLGYINFPEAEINGIEMDFRWVPAEQWDIGGNFAYNDAKISKTSTAFGLTAVEGTRLPLAPDIKGSAWVEYSLATEWLGAQPYIRFDYSHTGESVNSLAGLEAIVIGGAPTDQDDFDVGDLKFGIEGKLWNASVFIDNIWDERGEVFFNNRWGKQRLSVNQPRTFGITFRKRFR